MRKQDDEASEGDHGAHRVLVTWGTQNGGTAGIAHEIAEVLGGAGFAVTAKPAGEVRDASGFDAAIVGGALHANRWHADARRFVARNVEPLRRMPVWMFSSGPLDASAAAHEIPPPRQVEALMARVGALGHVTFGGRLATDVKGFPAEAMAKTRAGDWRDPERIRAWAAARVRELPGARPGRPVEPPGGSLLRLSGYALAGWALAATPSSLLLALGAPRFAAVGHAIAMPLAFALLATRYFLPSGAPTPIGVGVAFAATAALLDRALAVATSLPVEDGLTTWLPPGIVVVLTWIIGALMATMPWPKPAPSPVAHRA